MYGKTKHIYAEFAAEKLDTLLEIMLNDLQTLKNNQSTIQTAINTKTLTLNPTDGQTVFVLNGLTNPIECQMFVNGQKLSYPSDYSINSTILTYTSTDYVLKATDKIEFIYI